MTAAAGYYQGRWVLGVGCWSLGFGVWSLPREGSHAAGEALAGHLAEVDHLLAGAAEEIRDGEIIHREVVPHRREAFGRDLHRLRDLTDRGHTADRQQRDHPVAGAITQFQRERGALPRGELPDLGPQLL